MPWAHSCGMLKSPAMQTLPVQRPRVLCADDNPTILHAIRVAGQRAMLHVDCVTDGRAALDKSMEEGSAYDLVITDYEMPGGDGLALVRALRERGYSRAIIVMSGNLTPELSVEFTESGADLLIEKPFLPSTLVNSVWDLLGRSETVT